MTQSQWHVIGRGLAGWHAKGINVSSSGGDINPGVYWTGAPTRGYLQDAIDGCLIYDASEADETAFTRLILSGPMCNPALEPTAHDRFGYGATAARMAPAMEGAFQALAVAASNPEYSGLDYVGVDRYRALLQTVPGIKIGTVRAGTIEWIAQ